MGTHTNSVLTLANSIIGVSVLAMPFCFKQCGIMLSLVLLLVSNVVTRLACYYLIKSALIEKRRNFEMLALRVLGPSGKLLVEVCLIGFLLGTCVAFFVVLGDLGAPLVAELIGAPRPADLRFSVLVGVGVFVVLPLGLLRSIRSLSSVCALSIAFYFCLALKVVGEAAGHLVAGDWFDKVEFWRPAGVLQCIPIFSMALSCQTQLFEVFDWTPPAPLERAYGAVRSAVNMTMLFYMAVGFFGYVAFCNRPFNGNLLVSFSPSAASMLVRAGFVMSLAASFPLVIFPCRASIYSLLFRKGAESGQMAERRLRWISAGVVGSALGAAVMVPSIETVLGLVGSTIGVLVCVILPAVIFISRSQSRPDTERLLAKVLAVCGFVTMVLSTYANLYATDVAAGQVYVTEMAPPLRIVAPLVDSVVPAVADKLAEPLVVGEAEVVAVGAEPALSFNTSADRPAMSPSPVKIPNGGEPKKDVIAAVPNDGVKKVENKVLEVKEEEEKSRQEPPIPEEPRKPKKRIEDSVISKLREELRKRPILTLNEEMEKERKELEGKPVKDEIKKADENKGSLVKEDKLVKNVNKEEIGKEKESNNTKEKDDSQKRLEYERRKHEEEMARSRIDDRVDKGKELNDRSRINKTPDKGKETVGLQGKEVIIQEDLKEIPSKTNNVQDKVVIDKSIREPSENLPSKNRVHAENVNVNDVKREERLNNKGKLLVERMEQGVPLPLAVGHRERREIEHCDRKTDARIISEADNPATVAIDRAATSENNPPSDTLSKTDSPKATAVVNNTVVESVTSYFIEDGKPPRFIDNNSKNTVSDKTIEATITSNAPLPVIRSSGKADDRETPTGDSNQRSEKIEAKLPSELPVIGDNVVSETKEKLSLPTEKDTIANNFPKTPEKGKETISFEGDKEASIENHLISEGQSKGNSLYEEKILINKTDAEIVHVLIPDKREETMVAETVKTKEDSTVPAAVLLREEHRK